MKKLLSLFLALTLLCVMAAPAFAVRNTVNPDQTTWERWGYDSLEALLEEEDMNEASYYANYATFPEQTVWVEAYTQANPEETADFDADAYFNRVYGTDWTKTEYMDVYAMETEEAFHQRMMLLWICDQYWKEEDKATADAFAAAHPDKAASFDADAYFEANFLPYYNSKQAYMDYYSLVTEEDFFNSMLASYAAEQEVIQAEKDRWNATLAAEPELTAQFLADLDAWLAEYRWYGSLEEFMETMDCDCVEEAYNYLYDSWKYEYEYAQQRKAERDARITELGGTPDQINVLVNDRMISFGGSGPVIGDDGALAAPAEALSQAMGIMVKGDANGYAPVRFTAENAGWDVLWDADYQTAVLINRDEVIRGIDAKFASLDELYRKLLDLVRREEGQSYQIDETISLNLTAFDSLDGDKTYTANIKGTSTVRDGTLSASLTLNLAGLIRQLSPALKDALAASLPKSISGSALTELLTGIRIDVILNPEDGLYIHAPILGELLEDFDGDSWLYFESPAYTYVEEEGVEAVAPSLNLGTFLYVTNVYGYGYYYNQVEAYFDMMASVDTLAGYLGNDRFTISGDTVKYRLDTNTVNGLVAEATKDSYGGALNNAFRAADVSATLASGKLEFKAEVRPNTEAMALQGGYGGPEAVLLAWMMSAADYRLKANGSLTAGGGNYSLEWHQKNMFKANLEYTSTIRKTSAVPALEPPADADVVDAYEYLYGYAYPSLYNLYSMLP